MLSEILAHLKAEEQKILADINTVVQKDKLEIIAVLSKGEQIVHDELVRLHTYWAEVKALIEKVEALIAWKK
jgi:hypothetical protein